MVEESGERRRLTVELRPEETTIVSWRKLNGSLPPTIAPPLEQPAETEAQDAAAPHRFSAVIEKIERLYMGKNSSDEEDLDDIPDDDQYDTEDSFIDDAELDEYFQVDNSAVKHNGFYVNRGKLERITEPTSLPNEQPKKRQRKDMATANAESGNIQLPRKHLKASKMASGKSAPLAGKNFSDSAASFAKNKEHHVDARSDNQLITSNKISSDTKSMMDHSLITKLSNGDVFQGEAKHSEKQNMAAAYSKKNGNKPKDTTRLPGVLHHKHLDGHYSLQSKAHSGREMNGVEGINLSVRPKEKSGIHGQLDSNYSGGQHSMQVAKAASVHRKDGSSVRSRGSTLERAIRELEKMVAESRPSPMEVQNTDTSFQGVKRRLPPEVKQKLAKVARVAASHGKLSSELLDRLMGIVGHFMQLRTLKRNLKAMITTGLSAKQEKDDRFRQIKKEVTEMIQMRVTPKEFEHQAGVSDDFQESVKRKCSMDNALEEKISDLYDLYVDGLDEDVGPQIRKLYAELAELWPNGSMDNHGIKVAICRAKERKKVLSSQQKDQEKIRTRKLLLHKVEDTTQIKASVVGQPQYMQETLVADPNRSLLNTSIPARTPSSSINGPSMDREKLDKVKINLSNSMNETRASDEKLAKKKSKRKPEEIGEGHLGQAQLTQQDTTRLYHKSNLQAAATFPSLEQIT